MKFIKSINQLAWIFPFISFSTGYYLANIFFSINQIEVPLLIGKNLNEASKLLSENNLNLRILAQKEDSDLPNNTIIDQNPINQKIKSNKPVYLTISKKVNEFQVPNFKGKSLDEIQQISKNLNIKTKIYNIQNSAKEKVCITQYPEPGNLMDKNEKMILYVSSGNQKPIMIPNFKELELNEVINFLDLNEIKPTIILSNGQKYDPNKNYKIIDQRPIAGSILNLNKSLNIQLQVERI